MHLMLLPFLVDQVQQLCCTLFQATRANVSSKRVLGERIRNIFHRFIASSMERILRMIAHGFEGLQCPTYDERLTGSRQFGKDQEPVEQPHCQARRITPP
jgi:hypothetical protein